MAARQYGHVTRAQLLELGMAPRTIGAWTENHRLTPVHAGVYAVGHPQHSPQALAAAAVLACGPKAVLSHASAAALWGVRTWPRTPEVTCALERRRPKIRAHRTQTLATKDVRRHNSIRVTSPSRTVVDLQPRLSDAQLIRLVNDLRLEGHLGAAELQRLLTRSPRAKALIDPDEKPTRSSKEDVFLAFCKQHGLPRPKINTKVHGHEVDAFFQQEKVIVEIDGWQFHSDHQSFEDDRDRDADLAQYGFLTPTNTRSQARSCAPPPDPCAPAEKRWFIEAQCSWAIMRT